MAIRNNPSQFLNDLINVLDVGLRPSDDSNVESSRWLPAVDIKENADQFILTVDIPGVNPKDVEISMENNVLTLKGSREETINQEKQGYHRIERVKGSFYRRFTFPDTADADQVTAKSKHGVLEIIIAKKKAMKQRKITVESNE
jgi:HSP20 family protein